MAESEIRERQKGVYRMNEHDGKEIGEKLRLAIKKSNLRSHSELEKKSGVSRTTISRILNGKKKRVSLNTIVRLSNALECDVTDLIPSKQIIQ